MLNFKGFQDKEVEFRSRLTVAIGNNTAGKTTLLNAIQVGLGAYLQSLKSLRGGKAFRRNFVESDRFLRYDNDKKDYFPNSGLPRISIEADIYHSSNIGSNGVDLIPQQVSWYREYTKSGSTTHNQECAGELMWVVNELESRREYDENNAVLPIVLSFGTNRIDAQVRQTRKVVERQQRIEKAYKAALLDQVDFAGALDWLRRYEKSLKDGKEFEGTKNAFYRTLETAIPTLSDIDIDNDEIEAIVSIPGKTPERHHYSYMSDGLKSMINIVSEIAYRCIELNGFLGSNAVKFTPGVVLIDEVDLYLHPLWQKTVLRDLMKAFPNVQFIVTTHSPFIVQSLQEGELISFDDVSFGEGVPDKEGLEDIASGRMGMVNEIRSKRYNEMVEVATQYFKELDEGDASKAAVLKERLTEIEAEFSDEPAYLALIRAEYNSKKPE
jgi:ATP binding protein